MIVKLATDGFKEGRYTDKQGRVYTVARLVEHAKDLEVFEIPVAAIHIAEDIFKSITNARQLAEHSKRVFNANLEYPILLDPDGFIMDGWHRVCKALVFGIETVKAVRFEKLPVCEFVEES